jgi:tetratricopeptide (TPR) repeat protein
MTRTTGRNWTGNTALLLLLLPVGFVQVSFSRADEKSDALDNKKLLEESAQKLRDAAQAMSEGDELQRNGEYLKAIDKYRQARQLVPTNLLPLQRIGSCLHALLQANDEPVVPSAPQPLPAPGVEPDEPADPKQRLLEHKAQELKLQVWKLRKAQKAEAVSLLKEFVNGDEGHSADVADAKVQLDTLLLPRLSAAQKKSLMEATANLRAVEQLRAASAESSAGVPIKRAIDLLVQLTQEVPNYEPAYAKLGVAFEMDGDYGNASLAYQRYLDGYDKLGYMPNNGSDFLTQKIVCQARANKKKEEAVGRHAQGPPVRGRWIVPPVRGE